MSDPTLAMGDKERQQARHLSRQKLRPPTRVPGFEGEQFLGKGAFGEVWLAQDINTGRHVAIKFYTHRGGLDWSLLSREVEKLRFLFTDRHVVQLLQVGWDADPPYYVMEYLERGSLEDRLKREGVLPVLEAVGLIREVAVGLIHAHGKGILHCDVKPANILLDQDGKPRLADFGQSRLSHEQAPALGTLFYMAPEQADLKAAPDARWDVYALGAVFYHLLTGAPPYRDTPGATEIQQADTLDDRLDRYRRLIINAPEPREHRQVHGVNRVLAEVIERCLRVNPKERYANVQAVLDALDMWAVQQARRPLLVLGALGPTLVFLVLAGFAWRALDMTVSDSKDAVTARALDSNYFAARFVADRMALEIEKRWRILEHEADDAAFRQRVDKIRSYPPDAPEYKKLQAWIQEWVEERFRRYQGQFKPGTEARSWFVCDGRGLQVARSPFNDKTINQNGSHRDYFHGKGYDLDEHETPAPIRLPHRSNVFRSKSTKTLMVAFSVPIWHPDKNQKQPVGVLCMSVEVGKFLELSGSPNQFAVLVDMRRDAEGKRRGLIIEHPYLDGHDSAQKEMPVHYVGADVVARAEKLQHLRIEELQVYRKTHAAETVQEFAHEHLPAEQDYNGDYIDPVPGYDTEQWLATIEPIILTRGADDVHATRWFVVVQERYQEAVEAVNKLQTSLLHLGLFALAIVVVVVTALWGFVIFVLNAASGSRLMRAMRRFGGLPGSSISGSSGSAAPSLPSIAAMAPTVINEQVKEQNEQ